MTHTPWMVSLSDPKLIITQGSVTGRSEVVATAKRPRDAVVLAAAPDLLHTLQGLMIVFEDQADFANCAKDKETGQGLFDKARAAIEAATEGDKL